MAYLRSRISMFGSSNVAQKPLPGIIGAWGSRALRRYQPGLCVGVQLNVGMRRKPSRFDRRVVVGSVNTWA